MSIRHRLLPCLCIIAFATQTSCARNPVTGDLQLALISEEQEIQMGQEGARDVVNSIGLVDNPELQQYVSAIGKELAASSERPQLPWSFAVVNDPTPNAFALPGGPVFVTRGLMDLMMSEAQLATVLGHEIGHVTARHHVTALSRAQLAQIGLGVGGILFPQIQQFGGLASTGLQLVFLSHTRDAERQADELGFGYALADGYDVRQMPLVFQSLQRLGEAQRQSAIPSWLQSHPAPAERIQSVEERLATIPSTANLRVGKDDYLEQIEGLVYGNNPRNGFFREGRFFHPDLRFQLALPDQWQAQNLAQAVVALSPQQNAAVQLTLADAASVDAAAQAFLGQQGVQTGQTARRSINGLPAISATFRAASQGQTLQGVISFIAYEGRVYQIMGYAPVNVYPAYDATFQQTLASFAPLTDPSILAIEPNRLVLVRVEGPTTLADFDREYPSVVDLDELAILNQLDGPSARIPAGTLVKRIVGG